MRRLLIYLGHPAHFHLFKNLVRDFKEKGHEVLIVIKTKDILEELCQSENWEYVNVLPVYRRKSLLGFAGSYLTKYRRIGKLIRQFKPGLLLGSEPSLTHLGKWFRVPSFIFSEDDVHIIPQFAKIAYPYADVILSPESCDAGKWKHKKIAYRGFHKLAYLHPSVFTPDRSKIAAYLPEKFFILRLTELAAYHDTGRQGIQGEFAREIIALLEPHGKVVITSEKTLDPEFEKLRLDLPPELIHHALYFAGLYIGDSQSMAVEAALLGTPGIRFNDFAGEIGVLNELENTFGLTYSFKTSQRAMVLDKIREILANEDLKEEFRGKRKRLLEETINVPAFFSWFILNYPESRRIMQENPAYQDNFK
ncbi:MAG: hypothetical protein K0R65_2355 [Crocinitomicaceae bacterium]|jgi:predicted glycosyltransferase|nr:hypothetical protein [Crocinitomicaceae bacterium]